jgi:hypothetical protein
MSKLRLKIIFKSIFGITGQSKIIKRKNKCIEHIFIYGFQNCDHSHIQKYFETLRIKELNYYLFLIYSNLIELIEDVVIINYKLISKVKLDIQSMLSNKKRSLKSKCKKRNNFSICYIDTNSRWLNVCLSYLIGIHIINNFCMLKQQTFNDIFYVYNGVI